MRTQLPRMRRRSVLAGATSGLAVAALSGVAACSGSLEPEGGSGDDSGPDGSERTNPPEAPMLAELVEQGELPDVADRLPDDPPVIEPVERIGRYGGTWRSATTGPGDAVWMWRSIGYEPLVRVDYHSAEAVPNIAERFEVNDDGTEYVFTLHQGLKWSDGEPFTADDIVFWYDDVAMNEDISAGGPPGFMVTNDVPGVVEKVDDHTVRFEFPGGPTGMLGFHLAAHAGRMVTAMPKHYLSEFHAAYNDGVAELAAAEGYDSWIDLFAYRSGMDQEYIQVNLPTMCGWFMTTELGVDSRLVFERNPYYWKVDSEGSQLPYVDEVVFNVIADAEVMLLSASNGEFDYLARHINFPVNRPVLAQDREAGGYRLHPQRSAPSNAGVVALNLTHPDPVKREIFRNRDFRVGLSHAINREELINSVYQRQGEPWQAAPREECRFFDAEMAKQYTEHGVDLANDYLDRAGYAERDGEGFRLGPDGNRISFRFIASTTGGALESLLIDAQTLLKEQWVEVGIDIDTDPLERTLYTTRSANDDHDALMWTGFGGDDLTAIIDPRYYVPTTADQANYAAKWAQWYHSDGEEGEEPTDEVVRKLAIYDECLETPDPAERDELFRQVLEIAKEEFPVIGTVLYPDGYGVVSEQLRNVPDDIPDAWPFPHPAISHPEQYFFDG